MTTPGAVGGGNAAVMPMDAYDETASGGPSSAGQEAENASKRLLDVGAACRLDSGRLLQLYDGHSKLQVTWRFWAWVWLRCRMLLPNQVDAQQAIIQRMRQQLAAVTNAIARHGRPGG